MSVDVKKDFSLDFLHLYMFFLQYTSFADYFSTDIN